MILIIDFRPAHISAVDAAVIAADNAAFRYDSTIGEGEIKLYGINLII